MEALVSCLLGATLLFASGFAKAVKDTITFRFYTSVFKDKSDWWNPEKSWKYKYNDEMKPKFPGSTTIFVFLTDAWHLFQMIEGVCFALGIATLVGGSLTLWSLALTAVLGYAFRNIIFQMWWIRFKKV